MTSIDFVLELSPHSPDLIEALVALGGVVFEQVEPAHVEWRLTHMPEVSTFAAYCGARMVAFKSGYALSEDRYYSWLGGVHPDFRNRGIASELMERQHRWLRELGYATIETAANQANRAMSRLNLAHGFTVCGLRTDPGRVQVLYSKSLVDAEEPQK